MADEEQKLYKYRLEVGTHAENTGFQSDGNGNSFPQPVVYRQGDYFESPDPLLVERFGADKFTRLPDNFDVAAARQGATVTTTQTVQPNVPQTMTPISDLSTWNEKDLRAYAADEEIDVSKCKTKAELVKVLQQAKPVNV